MTKNSHTRNTEGLIAHAKAKSVAVQHRIDTAIRTLVKQNRAVNFNAVASLAHVSKTTLYNNPDYRTRIEQLRQNVAAASPAFGKHTVTDKSKDIIIAAKNKRISELEAEVERLSVILKRCYANEYNKY